MSTPLPPPLQVPISEAARLLGYSQRTIYRLLLRGELHATGHGRLRRIEYASIEAYVHRHRITPPYAYERERS